MIFVISGLYFGAIFQIVCIGSAVFLFPESKNNEANDFESASEMEISPQVLDFLSKMNINLFNDFHSS